jgi:hypothetical protein
VGSLIERLDALEADHAGSDVLTRPRVLSQTIAERLKALDPDLACRGDLEEIGKRLTALHQALDGHLAPAEGESIVEPSVVDAGVDAVAEGLVWFPSTQAEQVVITDELRMQLAALRVQADQVRTSLAEQADSELGRQREALAAEAERLSTIQASTSDIEARLTALAAEVSQSADEKTALLDETRTHSESAFAEALSTAQSNATVLLDEQRRLFEERQTAEVAGHEEVVKALTDKGDDVIRSLERLRTEAEDLVGAVGRTGLTGGFQQWEKAEATQADRMRSLAIWFGTATAIVILGLLILHEVRNANDQNTDFALVVGTVTLPGALGAVAAYAGRESARHRRNQVLARRTELELASFGPFIATLEPEMREELTAMFTTVFFGQAAAHTASVEGEEGPQLSTQELLGKIAESLPAIRRLRDGGAT